MLSSNYSFGQGRNTTFVSIDKPVMLNLLRAINKSPRNIEQVVSQVLSNSTFCESKSGRSIIVREKGNHGNAIEPGPLRENLISDICTEILDGYIRNKQWSFVQYRTLMTEIPSPRERSAKPKAAHRS